MKNYNPDVLSCLANLSNDEVFTPPTLANQILDMLPDEIWHNSQAKFLDPVCKSGVFLREIAKRLIKGLEKEIPDLQERLNHIFTQQLYGIAITDLTSLLSRRSVYCSKTANGKYSVCTTFKDGDGNIRFHEMKHTWKDGKCIYCGASQSVYDRGDEFESHAYEFIHVDDPNVIFNKMKFDVIIGNPPYQLNDGGGTGSSAKPIYDLFIEQAKKLNPRYLCMIIPARWYSGGKGLDDFRICMLHDTHIKELYDFPDSRDCFPDVDIAGGICYFLWHKDYKGPCKVTTIQNGKQNSDKRYLGEFEIFVRDNIAIKIIHKIKQQSKLFLDKMVSQRMPFGLPSNTKFNQDGDLTLITSTGTGKYKSDDLAFGKGLVNKWKVLLSKASSDHGGQPEKDGKRRIFSRIEVLPPKSICTESYLVIGPFNAEKEAINMVKYLQTKFCRFLVSTTLLTQNITRGKFIFVPQLPMDQIWTDQLLYKQFKLTDEEILYINLHIK